MSYFIFVLLLFLFLLFYFIVIYFLGLRPKSKPNSSRPQQHPTWLSNGEGPICWPFSHMSTSFSSYQPTFCYSCMALPSFCMRTCSTPLLAAYNFLLHHAISCTSPISVTPFPLHRQFPMHQGQAGCCSSAHTSPANCPLQSC